MDPLPADLDLLLPRITELLIICFSNKIAISDHTLLVRKHDYVVMRARTIHPEHELILKIAGPNSPIRCPFEQSAFLHRLIAAHTTIPIAEVFAADTGCERWPWRFLIRSAISGMEWANVRGELQADEVTTLHAQLGDTVAQLHNLTFPAFGEFDRDGVIQGDRSAIEALKERARLTIANPHLLNAFLMLLDRNMDLFINIDPPVLCHDDLHRHNILVAKRDGKWQIATFLDFDMAWAGHAEGDLARLELWDGMSSASFWQAYSARHVVSPEYAKRRPFYQLMWCLEYARQSEKHLADTNRLCDQLGMPRVERFT